MKDLIDRRTAIDAVLDRMDVEKYGRNAKPEEIQWALEKLPSALPGRKRGQWIDGYKRQTCSLCKGKGVRSWNYCPYCGADMREVDDE